VSRVARVAFLVLVLVAGCDELFGIDPVKVVDAPDARAPTPYAAAVLADAPYGYYRLGESAGVTAFNEVGGPAGTYLGNIVRGVPGALAGDADTAVDFDGDNSGVELGDEFDFVDLAPFSLELWLLPRFDGTFHNIVSKWQWPPSAVGYNVYQRDSLIAFTRELSPSFDLVEYTGLTAGAYTHIVATFDGSKLRLYIDGMERAQTPATQLLPDITTAFMIGSGNGSPTGNPTLGSLDEVAIYMHALPAVRVDAHYRAGRGMP
jgi:hypothetical protein